MAGVYIFMVCTIDISRDAIVSKADGNCGRR